MALADLVAALPDGLRQAFVLTQLTGLTYDQAAQVAGCAVGTIRSRVFRARERLGPPCRTRSRSIAMPDHERETGDPTGTRARLAATSPDHTARAGTPEPTAGLHPAAP